MILEGLPQTEARALDEWMQLQDKLAARVEELEYAAGLKERPLPPVVELPAAPTGNLPPEALAALKKLLGLP